MWSVLRGRLRRLFSSDGAIGYGHSLLGLSISNLLRTILRLQLRLMGSKRKDESSKSSGGDMTPPGLELNQS